jgi:tungstate transport system substrate-binding protein
MTRLMTAALLLLMTSALQAQPATQPSVRCAVINGMMHTNFWPQLAERFEKQTGIKVETLAFGEKTEISQAFRKGKIDLITMHASDQIINLVADGCAMDPQPWCRNDLVLIGPPSDPAQVKGMSSIADALKKIAANKSPLVVHASIGAQGVLRAIVDSEQIEFDPTQVTVLFEDRQREVLGIAQERGAYTLIGRIPFLTGRIPNHDMQLMSVATRD